MMIATDSAFDRSRLNRGKRIATTDDAFALFASPEDVILKKLIYDREGRSEKHLRDIAGVLKVQAERIDRHYIAQWADRLGVSEEWGLFPKQ